MNRGLVRLAAIVSTALVAVTACGGDPANGPGTTVAAQESGCRALGSTAAVHPDPAARLLVGEVLSIYAPVAWNAAAPPVRPSTLTGGVYINFRPEWDGGDGAPANTNVRTDGSTDAESGGSPRHDPLADLLILRGLDAYLSTGVDDRAADRLRCLLQPVVAAEFDGYGVERAWIYPQLLDLAALDPNGPWLQTARSYAGVLAKVFTDGLPKTGEFRSDWAAESAAALVDAGRRFTTPAWTSLGSQVARELCAVAVNPRTGLFPAAFTHIAGKLTVLDPLAKVGASAQLFDALLSVFDVTGDEQLRTVVRTGLAALNSPTAPGLADAKRGGWYYAVNSDGTGLRRDYKETRQAWMVGLLQHAAAAGLSPAAETLQARALVRDELFQRNARGFVYRVKADFSPFTSMKRGGPLAEDWISSEATGIALNALLGPIEAT